MKKLFLSLAFFLFFVVLSYAETDSSFYLATRFNVNVDFSLAKYNGKKTESDLTKENGDNWLQLWNSQKEPLVNTLIEQMNSVLHKFTYAQAGTNDTSSTYDINIRIMNIDDDGEVDASVSLCKTGGDALHAVYEKEMNGDGGSSNTFISLSKDGFRNLGEEIGQFLRTRIKQRYYTDGYFKIYAGYSSISEKTVSGSALNAGLSWIFNITGKHLPVFFEIGAEYDHYKVDGLELKEGYMSFDPDHRELLETSDINILSMPLHFSYVFAFNKNEVLVAPFVGEALSYKLGEEGLGSFTPLLSAGVNLSYKKLVVGYRFQKVQKHEFLSSIVDEYPNLNNISIGVKF